MPATAGEGRALRAYHERTKHSPAGLRSDPHALDWRIMPRPFKVYTDLDPIPLPRDVVSSGRPALASIAGEATPDAAIGLDVPALARLLFLSAGVIRHRRHPGGEIFFRAAACTGALYHVDLHLVCRDLPGLDAGVYHFAPHDFALRRLRTGDHRGAIVSAAANQAALAGAPVHLVYTSTFWRNAWKYRERTYRHCFWDSGTILANLLALASAASIPATVVQGFVDAEVNALLDLDTDHEVALGLVALGAGASPPPPAPPAPPLGLSLLPVSESEVDYPAIREAHEASSLRSGADVQTWRSAAALARPKRAPGPIALALPDLGAVAEPIETVILRRGSTREFPVGPIERRQLESVLYAATRPVPADVAPVPDLYLIVHAVEGLESGAYAVAPEGRTLTLLRSGTFRREAGFLALGQALAANAAVNLYWLVDLDDVLGRFGDRGYRAAQLTAAVAGGRTYLAAYAQRLGATGLTFFDDEVIAFFSPHAAGKSVLFLMAVGPRGRRSAGRS